MVNDLESNVLDPSRQYHGWSHCRHHNVNKEADEVMGPQVIVPEEA